MSARHPAHGLTLVELMMVIVVASILLAITMPSLRSLVLRNRLEGVVNELSMDMYYARSEALRRRTAVTVSTNNTGTQYTISTSTMGLKTVRLPTGVTVSNQVTVAFDSMRGATAGNSSMDVIVTGYDAVTLRASVTAIGRVSVCAVSGSLPGWSSC